MATLYPEVERLRIAATVSYGCEQGGDESAPARGPAAVPRVGRARDPGPHRRDASYWMGEIERIIAAPAEQVPFGRVPSDLIRLLTVDAIEVCRCPSYTHAWTSTSSGWSGVLLELDDRQCSRRGSDRKRGDMTIRQIVDEMLAGHIEEHCTQMAASLE